MSLQSMRFCRNPRTREKKIECSKLASPPTYRAYASLRLISAPHSLFPSVRHVCSLERSTYLAGLSPKMTCSIFFLVDGAKPEPSYSYQLGISQNGAERSRTMTKLTAVCDRQNLPAGFPCPLRRIFESRVAKLYHDDTSSQKSPDSSPIRPSRGIHRRGGRVVESSI